MKILSSSKNVTKNNSINSFFKEFNKDVDIEFCPVDNKKIERPTNDEVLKGVLFRNELLKEHCHKNNLDFDYLLSFQTGYFTMVDKYFMSTYCCIEDGKGKISLGISSAIEVSKMDYDLFTSSVPLNELIDILGEPYLNFITANEIKRETINFEALRNAFVNLKNSKEREKLNIYTEQLLQRNNKR